MMLALLAETRCLALSACFVLFVWCVCVIAVSMLPMAPLRRLQRLPRRWERTLWCRCIRWSMQLAACVRVHCACARFVGMFVHAILSGLLSDQAQSILRVRFWSLLFVCIGLFCSRGGMLVGTNKDHLVSSLPRRGFLHARTRTHWVTIACDLFPW